MSPFLRGGGWDREGGGCAVSPHLDGQPAVEVTMVVQ